MTTYNITANESVLIGRSKSLRSGKNFIATIHATGDFSSGTLTIQTSVDGGTTKTDTTFTATENKVMSITNLATKNTLSGGVEIYATVAGAGTPNIDVTYQDNA